MFSEAVFNASVVRSLCEMRKNLNEREEEIMRLVISSIKDNKLWEF